jgi:hypothetical protein
VHLEFLENCATTRRCAYHYTIILHHIMSASHTLGPFARALSIPELSEMITCQLTKNDCIQLALGSKLLFYLTIPAIWKSVPESFYLISLLPLSAKRTKVSNSTVDTIVVVSTRTLHCTTKKLTTTNRSCPGPYPMQILSGSGFMVH